MWCFMVEWSSVQEMSSGHSDKQVWIPVPVYAIHFTIIAVSFGWDAKPSDFVGCWKCSSQMCSFINSLFLEK